MKPSEALRRHREAIRRVIESHRTRNARVFGSVLSGKDTAIRAELRQLLGVPVEVLTPKALPEKMRAAVLAQARPV